MYGRTSLRCDAAVAEIRACRRNVGRFFMKMPLMKKPLGALLIVIVGAMGFVAAQAFWRAAPPPSTSAADQVEAGFKQAVQRIRPTLPRKVDGATTLAGISSAGLVMTYQYVVDSENYDLLPNYMQVAQSETTGLACNSKEVRDALRAGAAYVYRYSDAKSKPLGGFVVTSTDCK
jgi:hypothetical protein